MNETILDTVQYDKEMTPHEKKTKHSRIMTLFYRYIDLKIFMQISFL